MTLLSDFLSRSELAIELRISERTIARYEGQPGGLPSIMIGGRKLYRKSAVLEWIAARERKPNPRRAA